MTGDEVLVDVESIAAGGDGVARTDGMVVFVPRTAPGDRARVRMARSRRFARGRLVSLETPSPERVTPPCAHYVVDECGGCQIQHLSYDAQLHAKGAIIGDSLRRIGRRAASDPVVEASDRPWRYRRKLTLHLRRASTGWIAGLHPYHDPSAVFDLVDCPITDERVLAVWSELRTVFRWLPDAAALRVAVRLVEGGAAVTVEGGQRWAHHDAFLDGAQSVLELWWRPERGATRQLASRAAHDQAGASFVQVNAAVAAALRAHLLERVRAFAPRRLVDAYAGSGATAIPLAEEGRTVVAIEWDRSAAEQMTARLRPPSIVVAGRVEEHLPRHLPSDVVLLNPPRSGVDALVTATLQRTTTPPRGLFYVSCDPATLARDLARLPRYRLTHVRAFDMFPQTAHVETVCELVPEPA